MIYECVVSVSDVVGLGLLYLMKCLSSGFVIVIIFIIIF